MIAVLGSADEFMIRQVRDLLLARGADVLFLPVSDMPTTVQFSVELPGVRPSSALYPFEDAVVEPRIACDGGFRLPHGERIPLHSIRAVYQRVGFHPSQAADDYTPDEAAFAHRECVSALFAMLDSMGGLVVNRPVTAGTNASKPYQTGLIARSGFRVPATVVTAEPDVARDFYRTHGSCIYKSISSVRSIVRPFTDADLDRLDALRTCPVQLQERVDGTDVRVHVVGTQVFPSRVVTRESDYRYDKEVQVTAAVLPADVALRCVRLAHALGFVLAGIDLRVTPEGQYYCFEVNPTPAYGWYERHTGQPISSALCDVLMAADR